MSHKLRKPSDVNFTKDELVFIQYSLINAKVSARRDSILDKIEAFHNAQRLAASSC